MLTPIDSPEALEVGRGAYLVELEDPTDFQSPLAVKRVRVEGILKSAFVEDPENGVTVVEEVAAVSTSVESLAIGTKSDIKPTSMLFTASEIEEVIASANDRKKSALGNHTLSGALRNKEINKQIAGYLMVAEFQRDLQKLPTIEESYKNPQPKPAEEI